MHLSRLLALGPDVVRPGKLMLELVLTLRVVLLKKRPAMLSGPVALFGFKADKSCFHQTTDQYH
jgi:hypothetical protein